MNIIDPLEDHARKAEHDQVVTQLVDALDGHDAKLLGPAITEALIRTGLLYPNDPHYRLWLLREQRYRHVSAARADHPA
jgi:hypothetical protein